MDRVKHERHDNYREDMGRVAKEMSEKWSLYILPIAPQLT